MEEPSHADIIKRIEAMHKDIAELKASSQKFERLHTAGKVTLVVMLGIGSFVSFCLLVANQIKSLWH